MDRMALKLLSYLKQQIGLGVDQERNAVGSGLSLPCLCSLALGTHFSMHYEATAQSALEPSGKKRGKEGLWLSAELPQAAVTDCVVTKVCDTCKKMKTFLVKQAVCLLGGRPLGHALPLLSSETPAAICLDCAL